MMPRLTESSLARRIAQAAWETAQRLPDPAPSWAEGVMEQLGGIPGADGWNAVIAVTTANLSNAVDGVGLPERFLAWIRTRTDSDGEVVCELVCWGHDEGLRSGSDAVWDLWSTFENGLGR